MNVAETLKSWTQNAAPLAQARLSPLMSVILAFLLATTASAVLFAIYAILGPEGGEREVKTPEWTPPTQAVVNLDPPKTAADDVQSLTRPIFSKSRRPSSRSAPARAEPDAAPAAGNADGLTVYAIVKNGNTSQAFVTSLDAPEGAWKKIGDTIDAWTISSIDAAELTLKNGDRSATLRLYPANPE